MNILLLIKGIIIGVAKIIPGLSGAVLMLSFNLYDKAINAVTNFFDNTKKNFLFLSNLGIGILIGIVLFSKIIYFFINNYYLYTTSLFIGLIFGGIPVINRNVSKNKYNIIVASLSLILMLMLALSNLDNTYIIKNNYMDIIIFLLAGLLEAIGTILPGVSSTALLMLVGVYNIYISTISNIFNIEYLIATIRFIIPFSIGLLAGCIFLSILIDYLFKNYKEKTFSFILGISISSIILLSIKVLPFIHNIQDIIISITLSIVGYLIVYKM